MSRQSDLHHFTRIALADGHAAEEIAEALAATGWSAGEIRDALGAWDIHPGLPPVPRRERAALTAEIALIEGLYLVALIMMVGHLVQLLLTLTDILLPTDQSPSNWQLASMRWPIAAIVVFLPLWLWSGLRARPAKDQNRPALSVWIGHLAVFFASLTLLGDALAIMYRFLSDDMTTTFMIKTAAVALVAGLVILAMQERRHA